MATTLVNPVPPTPTAASGASSSSQAAGSSVPSSVSAKTSTASYHPHPHPQATPTIPHPYSPRHLMESQKHLEPYQPQHHYPHRQYHQQQQPNHDQSQNGQHNHLIEPDDLWKAATKQRIDANLEALLHDARQTYEQKVDATQPREEDVRTQLYIDYLQSIKELRKWARDEYAYAVQRERQEIEWTRESRDAGVNVLQDEDPEEAKRREEQYLMLDEFRRRTEERLGGARPVPVEAGYLDLEYVPPSVGPASEGPGTPTRENLLLGMDEVEQERYYNRQAEELSRLLSATPSPPASPAPSSISPPSVSAPLSPLPGESSLDHSPASSASTELSGAEGETDDEGAVEVFTPPSRAESVVSSSENSIIFTPDPKLVDEETRLKEQKRAEQQEAFRKRAEEIKRKVMQRKVLKQLDKDQEEKKPKQIEAAPSADDASATTDKDATSTTENAAPQASAATTTTALALVLKKSNSKYPSAPPSVVGASAPPSATRERFAYNWNSKNDQPHAYRGYNGYTTPPSSYGGRSGYTTPPTYQSHSGYGSPAASTGRRTGSNTPADYTPYIFRSDSLPNTPPMGPTMLPNRPTSSASRAAVSGISFSGFGSVFPVSSSVSAGGDGGGNYAANTGTIKKSNSASASANSTLHSSFFGNEPISFESHTPKPKTSSSSAAAAAASRGSSGYPYTATPYGNFSSAASATKSRASASAYSHSHSNSHSYSSSFSPSHLSQEEMMRIYIMHDQQWMRITQQSAFPTLSFADFPWPLLSHTSFSTGTQGGRTTSAAKGLGVDKLTYDTVEEYMFGAFGITRKDVLAVRNANAVAAQSHSTPRGYKYGSNPYGPRTPTPTLHHPHPSSVPYVDDETQAAVARTRERIREHARKWDEGRIGAFLGRVKEDSEREKVRSGARAVRGILDEMGAKF